MLQNFHVVPVECGVEGVVAVEPAGVGAKLVVIRRNKVDILLVACDKVNVDADGAKSGEGEGATGGQTQIVPIDQSLPL